jgi:hypothetical protein
MCIPIARQRLGKHIPGEENSRNNGTSMVKQRISKYTSLATEAVLYAIVSTLQNLPNRGCVFCLAHAKRL